MTDTNMDKPEVDKMVRLSQATKDRLDQIGRKTETYNDVISRLLDEFEAKKTTEAR